MADQDQDFMLNAIHMELQETNKLLLLIAQQQAAVYAKAADVLKKYEPRQFIQR